MCDEKIDLENTQHLPPFYLHLLPPMQVFPKGPMLQGMPR